MEKVKGAKTKKNKRKMLETDSTAPLLSSRSESFVDYQTIASNQSLPAGDDLRSTDFQPEKWNEPRTNVWRILATFYSFIIVGANDGAYGVRHESTTLIFRVLIACHV